MDKPLNQSYEFGPFRLDVANRLLLREGKTVPLKRKAFDVLLLLVTRHGLVIEKEELMLAVWPDTFVEDANLTQSIYLLRKALGQNTTDSPYIETIPGRGYRFAATVIEVLEKSESNTLGRLSDGSPINLAVSRTEITSAEVVEETSAAAMVKSENNFFWQRSWRWLGVILLFLGGVGVVAYGWFSKPGRVKTLAVLPFSSLGGDEEEALKLGLTEATINRLNRLNRLVVRPLSAVRRYASPTQDPLAAGREQQVEAVMVGSLQQTSVHLRVTVQLFRVRDGGTLWSGVFDEQWSDVFTVQDVVAQRLAEALKINLAGAERNLLTRHDTESATAYRLYLKGRIFYEQRTEAGFRKALNFFNQAIAEDPQYALAYAGLADCFTSLHDYSIISSEEGIPRARSAVQRALALDDSLAETHAALGRLKFYYEWDYPTAEREFRRAIELNPNYATAHLWYAEFLRAMGRHGEAQAEVKRARELDPLSLIISTSIGVTYFFARQYIPAIEQYRKTLEIDPNYLSAISWLGMAYEQTGQYQEAITTFQKELEILGPGPATIMLERVYILSGRRDEARRLFNNLMQTKSQKPLPAIYLALHYSALGESIPALDNLEKAYAERETYLVLLNVDPRFDGLRAEPRFHDLLRRVRLE